MAITTADDLRKTTAASLAQGKRDVAANKKDAALEGAKAVGGPLVVQILAGALKITEKLTVKELRGILAHQNIDLPATNAGKPKHVAMAQAIHFAVSTAVVATASADEPAAATAFVQGAVDATEGPSASAVA